MATLPDHLLAKIAEEFSAMQRLDFMSQEYLCDPVAGLAKLRAAGPVVKVRFPIIGKTWITTTHDLAGRVLKDNETFAMRRQWHGCGPALVDAAGGYARSRSACSPWTSPTTRACAASSTKLFAAAPFSTWSREFSRLPTSLRPSCSLTESRRPRRALCAQAAAHRHLRAARTAECRPAPVHRLGEYHHPHFGPGQLPAHDREASGR